MEDDGTEVSFAYVLEDGIILVEDDGTEVSFAYVLEDGTILVENDKSASFPNDSASSTDLTECRNGSPKNLVAFLFRDEARVPSRSSVVG